MGKGCEHHIETYKQRCHAVFPLARAFKPPVLNNNVVVDDAKKALENDAGDLVTSSPSVTKNVDPDAGDDATNVSPVANGATS